MLVVTIGEAPVAAGREVPVEGWRMDVVSAKVLAAQMLGVPSMEALAREQVRRALLPGGRVEAHEYGRKQHSSASAGGVLIGLAGSAAVSDSIVAPLVSVVAGWSATRPSALA